MLRSALAVVAVVASATVAVAGMEQQNSSLLHKWQLLNIECRGGSNDAPETGTACSKRSTVERQLAKRGCRYDTSWLGKSARSDKWLCPGWAKARWE